jgi:hypothetical protein
VQYQKRLAGLTKALMQTAAYLPAGRSWKEARAKQRALEAQVRKLTKSGGLTTGGFDLIDRVYRLRVQIYDDVKALDLTSCLGPPPRAPISG